MFFRDVFQDVMLYSFASAIIRSGLDGGDMLRAGWLLIEYGMIVPMSPELQYTAIDRSETNRPPQINHNLPDCTSLELLRIVGLLYLSVSDEY